MALALVATVWLAAIWSSSESCWKGLVAEVLRLGRSERLLVGWGPVAPVVPVAPVIPVIPEVPAVPGKRSAAVA